MSTEFNLEQRRKAVEKATELGMLRSRDKRIVEEALEWFLTPEKERGVPPELPKVKRLIRMLSRLM